MTVQERLRDQLATIDRQLSSLSGLTVSRVRYRLRREREYIARRLHETQLQDAE